MVLDCLVSTSSTVWMVTCLPSRLRNVFDAYHLCAHVYSIITGRFRLPPAFLYAYYATPTHHSSYTATTFYVPGTPTTTWTAGFRSCATHFRTVAACHALLTAHLLIFDTIFLFVHFVCYHYVSWAAAAVQ